MTKSFITEKNPQNVLSKVLVNNIIARKLTMKSISKQVIYNLNIYLREKETFKRIIIFLFLSFIQFFFYTLGAFLATKHSDDKTPHQKYFKNLKIML